MKPFTSLLKEAIDVSKKSMWLPALSSLDSPRLKPSAENLLGANASQDGEVNGSQQV